MDDNKREELQKAAERIAALFGSNQPNNILKEIEDIREILKQRFPRRLVGSLLSQLEDLKKQVARNDDGSDDESMKSKSSLAASIAKTLIDVLKGAGAVATPYVHSFCDSFAKGAGKAAGEEVINHVVDAVRSRNAGDVATSSTNDAAAGSVCANSGEHNAAEIKISEKTSHFTGTAQSTKPSGAKIVENVHKKCSK